MRETERSDGIVLKRYNLPGTNAVVTIFTEEFGKLVFIVPNLRTKSSRRSSLLQTGNFVNISWHTKQEGTRYLKTITLISGLATVKESLPAIRMLYTVLFVVDRLVPAEEREHGVYRQILSFVKQVADKNPNKDVLYTTLAAIVAALGYGDQLSLSREALIQYIQELIDDRIPYDTI